MLRTCVYTKGIFRTMSDLVKTAAPTPLPLITNRYRNRITCHRSRTDIGIGSPATDHEPISEQDRLPPITNRYRNRIACHRSRTDIGTGSPATVHEPISEQDRLPPITNRYRNRIACHRSRTDIGSISNREGRCFEGVRNIRGLHDILNNSGSLSC
jgi:hypothetical protein